MPRPLRHIAEGLVYHVINRGNNGRQVFYQQHDEHLLRVLRYIEANPLRAGIAAPTGEYRWSSFAAHGLGQANELLAPVIPYEALAVYPAVRRRRWSAYVHQQPEPSELAAIRRSNETGLPFGGARWVARLAKRLKLDLTIRPRGRPRKKDRSQHVQE